jgi:hypothetical protein
MAFTLIEIDFKAARRFIKWIFGFTVQMFCTDKPIVTLYASFIKKQQRLLHVGAKRPSSLQEAAAPDYTCGLAQKYINTRTY